MEQEEKEARRDLLKIPDSVALKYCAIECKRLEKRLGQQTDLIAAMQEQIDEERLRRISLLEVLKQFNNITAYETIKKEAKKIYEYKRRESLSNQSKGKT